MVHTKIQPVVTVSFLFISEVDNVATTVLVSRKICCVNIHIGNTVLTGYWTISV